MPTVEIDGTNSTVKTNVLTSQSASAITVPTGKVLTVTDAAGLTVAGTAVTPASYLSAIPDNSVTGGKLNISLLAGDTMYASGTDTLAKLAKGTAAQVLTMNAGATAPEWATAAGGGAWTVITSTNVSSTVASVDFVHGTGGVVIDATYRTYAVIWEGVVSNTNIDSLTAVLGDSSGFDTGSGDYKFTATYTYNNNAGSPQGSASATKIDFAGMYSGTASGSSIFGQATFTRPVDSASFPSVRWGGGCYSHSSAARETTGVGVRTAAITVDRIKFAFYTGSIIRGRFTLYGIAHA